MAERSANTPRPRDSGTSQTARTGNRITVDNNNGYGNVPSRRSNRSTSRSSSGSRTESRSDSRRSSDRASSRSGRSTAERTSLGRVNTRSGAGDGSHSGSPATTRDMSAGSSRSSSGSRSSDRSSTRDSSAGRTSGSASGRTSTRTSNRTSARTSSRASLNDRGTWRSSRNDIYVGGNNRSPLIPIIIGIVGIAALLALLILFIIPTCSGFFGGNEETEVVEVVEPTRVSFVAVGDNLPDDYIGTYADKQAGEEGDKTYDYSPIYEPIKSYVQDADLAYVKEETHIGGNELGPCGYPSFNTTDEMADAIVNTGFDFVASASNHAYDWGLYDALTHSVNLWQTKPVAFTGTAVTEEQYNRIATVERDGITFALLDYTYGVNGFEKEELPDYAVNFIDEERIASDVARAKKVADVVLVAMHWGTENLTEADDEQKHLAQFLANLDVDVVLGSHPHVIGPVAWVDNANGSGHRTLVAYSLGNFLADHESPNQINVLEGMLMCDFVKTPVQTTSAGEGEGSDASSESSGSSASAEASSAAADEYTISIENVKWVPLVCHSNEARDDFAIYAVDDYPEDVARENRVFTDTEDPIAWLNKTTASIVSSEFFDYEPASESEGEGETNA